MSTDERQNRSTGRTAIGVSLGAGSGSYLERRLGILRSAWSLAQQRRPLHVRRHCGKRGSGRSGLYACCVMGRLPCSFAKPASV